MISTLFRSNFMMCATYSMEDLRLLNLNRKQSTHRFVIKCKIWKSMTFLFVCLYCVLVLLASRVPVWLLLCSFSVNSSCFFIFLSCIAHLVGFCCWTRKLTFLSVWVECWKVSCIISGKYPQLLELLQFHPGISTPFYVMFGCALDFESIMLA